jgi:hypothetical protein
MPAAPQQQQVLGSKAILKGKAVAASATRSDEVVRYRTIVGIIAHRDPPVEFDGRGRPTAFEDLDNRKPDLCRTLSHQAGTAWC